MDAAIKIDHHSVVKTESSILKTLSYFDIFHYPITISEIIKFSEYIASEDEFNMAIERLVDAGAIFQFDTFYCLENNFSRVKARTEGNARAERILPRAKKIAAFLFKFPYVRAVGVSGSLSKNFADKKGDIDFFIITKSNRLWIARTIMHLFKKLTYLFGMQHSFCMNYYVDETMLGINEKNIYTAIEVKTLLPLAGKKSLADFFGSNQWSDDWLPNFQPSTVASREKHSLIQGFIEWLLNNKVGDKLDNYLFSVTSNRWARKELAGKKNIKGRTMTLLTGKHFSRSNPDYFQEKILQQYHSRVEALKNNWPEFF